jgi:hypothetical protein
VPRVLGLCFDLAMGGEPLHIADLPFVTRFYGGVGGHHVQIQMSVA